LRSSLWRPLTERIRHFPEGVQRFVLFPIFTKLIRKLAKWIPTLHEYFWSPLDPCNKVHVP